MKTSTTVLMLVLTLYAANAMARERTQDNQNNRKQYSMDQPASERMPSPQSRPEPSGDHQPPPQAYEDCKGKKAGDTVQHTTREGVVAATCEDSPQGLVARPNQKPGARQDKQQPQRRQPREEQEQNARR